MESRGERSRMYGPPLLMVLGLGLILGMALDRWMAFGMPMSEPAPNFRLISQAWRLIERYYADRPAVQPRAMTYGAISGMVDALGDTGHSRFLSPAMVKEMGTLEQSKFQGIGAEVQLKNGHVVIAVPLDGSPAQHAGLKPGDAILEVNGKNVAGESLDQVVKQIAGPAGTSVTLTILEHATGKTREVTLKRATIHINNVTWQMLPASKIVDLRIAGFENGVTQDLRKALRTVANDSAAGIVLDLRNNPGGLLGEAVGSASQFLTGGNVLLVKNAKGQEQPVPVEKGGQSASIRLVVLINGGTASGAEIMAGALQDAKRALLVGETTFGTGTVLSEFGLSDGSALLLAVDEWLTPDGHVIWHKGIAPNVVVALPANVTPLFPESEREMTAAEVHDSHDAQLLQAVKMLQQPAPAGPTTASPQVPTEVNSPGSTAGMGRI